jgi:hypothetical protein
MQANWTNRYTFTSALVKTKHNNYLTTVLAVVFVNVTKFL